MSIQGCVRLSLLVQLSVTRLTLPRPLFARFLSASSSSLRCTFAVGLSIALVLVHSRAHPSLSLTPAATRGRFCWRGKITLSNCTGWAVGLGY